MLKKIKIDSYKIRNKRIPDVLDKILNFEGLFNFIKENHMRNLKIYMTYLLFHLEEMERKNHSFEDLNEKRNLIIFRFNLNIEELGEIELNEHNFDIVKSFEKMLKV